MQQILGTVTFTISHHFTYSEIHVFSSRFLNVLVGRYLAGTPRHKEILNVKLLRGHSIFVPTNFLVNAISKNSQRTKPVTPASFVY